MDPVNNKTIGPEFEKLSKDLHEFIHSNKGKEHPALKKGERSYFVSRKTSWGLELLAYSEEKDDDTHIEISLSPRELHKWLKEAGVGCRLGVSFKGVYLMWKRSFSDEKPGVLAIFLDPENPAKENIAFVSSGNTAIAALENNLSIRKPSTEKEMFIPAVTIAKLKVLGSTVEVMRVK
jgi:hypothetical protein